MNPAICRWCHWGDAVVCLYWTDPFTKEVIEPLAAANAVQRTQVYHKDTFQYLLNGLRSIA